MCTIQLPNSCVSLQPQYNISGSGIDNMRMSVSIFYRIEDSTLSCSVTITNCIVFSNAKMRAVFFLCNAASYRSCCEGGGGQTFLFDRMVAMFFINNNKREAGTDRRLDTRKRKYENDKYCKNN